MAFYQSLWATSQRNTPSSGCAGVEVVEAFEFEIPTTALAVGDIIELAILPANNTIRDAILACDVIDTGVAAFDIGIMSGDVGDKDNPRTSGTELFAAQVVNTATAVVRAQNVSAFTIEASPTDRSIGVKITTAPGTQVPGKMLRLLLKYAAV
jgi:hypothetical protein